MGISEGKQLLKHQRRRGGRFCKTSATESITRKKATICPCPPLFDPGGDLGWAKGRCSFYHQPTLNTRGAVGKRDGPSQDLSRRICLRSIGKGKRLDRTGQPVG